MPILYHNPAAPINRWKTLRNVIEWGGEGGLGMKVLITGGAGFIGGNFVRHQLEHRPEDSFVCLDALTYAGNLSSLEEAMRRPNFRFVRGDISDRDAVGRLFSQERPDALVNFAAESHVDRSIGDPALFLRTNAVGAQVLLDACRAHGASFLQISTDEVYGDLPLEGDSAFTEGSPLRPSSPYSASKASADLLALAYFRTYGLPVTVARASNNFGPWQFPEKLIPKLIARALQNRPLPLYGHGGHVRDWLYVGDCVRALDEILRRGQPGEVYNVGGGNPRANLDVARAVLRALERPESLIAFVPDRPGHDARYALDCAKIRRELGWVPEISFEDGIESTVRWYVDHRAWWTKTPGL